MATICTTTTLDCATEVLLPWVSYHLGMGIDHMFLFFDNPEHEGISALKDNPKITAVRCDAEYWPGGARKRERLTLHERQWYNANKALQWAREKGFDWIIHFDSDELLYYSGSLQDALASLPNTIEVVRFRVYEAVPQKLFCSHPFADIRFFRVGPTRPTRKTMPRSLQEWLLAAHQFASYNVRLGLAKLVVPAARGPFLRGHIGGKSAVRTVAPISGMGVHVPAPPAGHVYHDYFLPGAAVLHFDCSDFASWMSKWEGRARESHVPRNRDKKRRKQLQRFLKAKAEGQKALESLFATDYVITETQVKLLEHIGLVTRLDLLSLFNSEDSASQQTIRSLRRHLEL